MRPLLVLEVNEVPWRMLDRYLKDDRFPHVQKFFSDSRCMTNVAIDSGELSPWVTWPTWYRGMSAEQHHIRYLGQDIRTYHGVPLWDEYRNRGLTIGVCGSLQSWPPKDPGPHGFYIPDTFAHDESCIPKWVEPFQKFNLGQVSQSARVITRSSFLSLSTFSLLLRLPFMGIRFSTLLKTAAQVIAERFYPARVSRRPIFQSILVWDVFRKLYHPKNPPAFASLFTNHIAGVMHRYWDQIIPEDFAEKKIEARPHLATMDFAISVLDGMLREVMDWQNTNPELLVVLATSMGQAAIKRDAHEGVELSVKSVAQLVKALGFSSEDFTPLLAMNPQVAVEMKSEAKRIALTQVLESARTQSGNKLFQVLSELNSMSITFLNPSAADIRANAFSFTAFGGQNERLTWEQAGFAVNQVDAGTAYHIPEGVMAIRGKGIDPDSSRTPLPADQVKAYLMNLAGINQIGVKSPIDQNVTTSSS